MFSVIFLYGKQLFWLHVCFPAHQIPSRWEYSKGKEFASFPSELILSFRIDPFSALYRQPNPFWKGVYLNEKNTTHQIFSEQEPTLKKKKNAPKVPKGGNF